MYFCIWSHTKFISLVIRFFTPFTNKQSLTLTVSEVVDYPVFAAHTVAQVVEIIQFFLIAVI